MPKLCRIHLAGFGTRKARFNPLSLDFCNPEGIPQDSVLFLRNGGGKTSLISLFYSVFLPHREEFLGKKKGKNRLFDDYVRPGELAVLLVQLAFPAHGGHRRTFGVAALRRDRDPQATRTFFSFKETPETAWENLPVYGLADPPAENMERLLAHFESVNARARQAVDWQPFTEQSLWREHLDQVHFDPGVLRHHLKMNADEGGVVELFKHTETRDFARLFLELTIDPESLYADEEKKENRDLLHAQLVAFRSKVAREPELRSAVAFCDAVRAPLDQVQAQVRKRVLLQEEQKKIESSAAQLRTSLRNHLTSLEGRHESLRKERGELETSIRSKTALLNHLKSWRATAEFDAVRLDRDESSAAATAAGRAHDEAEKSLRTLKAGLAKQKCDVLLQRIATIQAQLEQLDAERAPYIAELRGIGSELGTALQRLIGDTRASRDEANRLAGAAEEHRNQAQERGRNFAVRQAYLETRQTSLRENLRSAEKARDRLREQNVILESETPAEALARTTRELQGHQATLSTLDATAKEKRTVEAALGGEIRGFQNKLTECQGEERALKTTLDQFESDLNDLAATEPMRAILQGSALVPWNPAVAQSLSDRQGSLSHELKRLVVANAADDRTTTLYRPDHVFPPPLDVAAVIEALRRIGVTHAMPVYHYLDGTATALDASERLRNNPAVYSGILIQNDEEFRMASEKLSSAACSMPVVLVSRAFFSASPAERTSSVAVVLPEDSGLWNRAQATANFPVVVARHGEGRRAIEETETTIKSWTEAAGALIRLVREFPESRVSTLRESHSAISAQIQHLSSEIKRCEEEQSIARSQATQVEAEWRRVNHDFQAAGKREFQLTEHVRLHETPAEAWKRELKENDAELTSIPAKIEECRGDALRHQDEFNRQNGIRGAADTTIALLENEQREIPLDYRDPQSTTAPRGPLDFLRELFKEKRAVLEGRFNRTVAAGQLQEMDLQRQTAERDLRVASEGLDQEEIAVAALFDDLDGKISKASAQRDQTAAEKLNRESRKNDAALAFARAKSHTAREPGRLPPATAADARAQAIQYGERFEQTTQETKTLEETKSARDSEFTKIDGELPLYRNLLTQLGDDVGEPTSELHLGFTGTPRDDSTLVDAMVKDLARLRNDIRRTGDAIREIYDDRIQKLCADPRFVTGDVKVIRKFAALPLSEIEPKIADRIDEVNQARSAAKDELDSFAEDRNRVLKQLDQRARLAEKRLGELERASRMPPAITAWAGRPFLQVNVHASNDPTERNRRLEVLLERWVRSSGDLIPAGVELAHACLDAVLGDRKITIRILKPEYQLLPDTYDISLLHTFSGGEKVTAAILLYCVLVRYRAQHRGGEDVLGSDAGFLLLDNPFGQVTLLQFIDLQVRIAKLMGVQLIYATGVADFTALAAFPHRLTLRNAGTNAQGDRLIRKDDRPQDDVSFLIEAMALGEKSDGRNGDSDDDDA